MEIKGRVIQSLGVQSGTSKAGKPWSKASVLVETAENPQYPKRVVISNMKNADAFSKIAVDTDVIFKVEIESREYNGRWYTEVSCWGWDVAQQPYQQAAQQYPPQQGYPQQGYAPQQQAPQAQSGTPTLDSLGVQGFQGQFAQQPAQAQGEDDLPF